MIVVIILICLAVFIWAVYQGWDLDGIGGAILGGVLGVLVDFLIFILCGLLCMGVMSCYDEAKCDVIYGEKTE